MIASLSGTQSSIQDLLQELKKSASEGYAQLEKERYQTLLETHSETCGDGTTVLAAASGRLMVSGEQLDYQYGRVLNTVIDKELVVAVSARVDSKIRIQSLNFDEPSPALAHLRDFIPLPKKRSELKWWETSFSFIREFSTLVKRLCGVELPGFNITIDSRKTYGGIPIGIGLSSSSALEVSLALALCKLAGLRDKITDSEITYAAKRSEEALGFYSGIQDPWACLHASVNLIECVPSSDVAKRQMISAQSIEMPTDWTATILRVLDSEDAAHLRLAHNHWVAESEVATVLFARKIQKIVGRTLEHPPAWKPGYFRSDILEQQDVRISHEQLLQLANQLPNDVRIDALDLGRDEHAIVDAIIDKYGKTDTELRNHSFFFASIMRHFFAEDSRAFLSAEAMRKKDATTFARLQHETHEGLVTDCRIRNPVAESVVRRLQEMNSVLACRLLGPGAGSSIVVWSKREAREKMVSDIATYLESIPYASFDSDSILPIGFGRAARILFPR